jgi:multidrug efflux system membrane fusion protein
VGDPRPRFLVEERAVSSDQRGDYLLLVDEKNVVQYRSVQLGRADAGLRVIEKGLEGGERVVINGLQRARPGAEVTPEVATMAAIAGAMSEAFRLEESQARTQIAENTSAE